MYERQIFLFVCVCEEEQCVEGKRAMEMKQRCEVRDI